MRGSGGLWCVCQTAAKKLDAGASTTKSWSRILGPVWPDRNTEALPPGQVEHCQTVWALITDGGRAVPLDVSRASTPFTTTGYGETHHTVYLGANAYPNPMAVDANSRLSVLACLAHEYAHAERHARGYQRPKMLPDLLLDEAEASIYASFHPALGRKDREDLVEDARDQLIKWLGYQWLRGES